MCSSFSGFKPPKVSVVMPAYNAIETIADSIESVLNQSSNDFELIIIDDASTDETIDFLREIRKKKSCILVIERSINGGVAAARNIGIESARGKYIAFLDSDDLWLPDKLKKQLSVLESGRSDVVCSSYLRLFPDGRQSVVNARPEFSFGDMLGGNLIGNLTGIYNTEKLGKFYQKSVGHEDYLMWLDIMKKTDRAVGLNDVLASYRVFGGVSSNKFRAARWTWNIYRHELKLGYLKGTACFLRYASNALFKRL